MHHFEDLDFSIQVVPAVSNFDLKTLKQIKLKKRKNFLNSNQEKMFKILPTFMIQFLFYVHEAISYYLGMDFKYFGIKKHQFGSALVTDFSEFGVEEITMPTIQILNSNVQLVICKPVKRGIVVDDKP